MTPIVGTEGPDALRNKVGPNTIMGLGGDDWLFGNLSSDILIGGPGDDLYFYELGQTGAPDFVVLDTSAPNVDVIRLDNQSAEPITFAVSGTSLLISRTDLEIIVQNFSFAAEDGVVETTGGSLLDAVQLGEETQTRQFQGGRRVTEQALTLSGDAVLEPVAIVVGNFEAPGTDARVLGSDQDDVIWLGAFDPMLTGPLLIGPIQVGSGAVSVTSGPKQLTPQAATLTPGYAVQAGAGDDMIVLGAAASVGGEEGVDTLSASDVSGRVRIDLLENLFFASDARSIDDFVVAAITGLENVIGSFGDDEILGDGGANDLHGLDGDDLIDGRMGADLLVGGAGRDVLMGGFGEDDLFGDAGNDRLLGGAQHDRLGGGVGRDVLLGGAGHDWLRGRSGGDRLDGGVGADRLIGDGGADRLKGGMGDDLLTGGAGDDRFIFSRDAWGRDRITDFTDGSDVLDLTGSGFVFADLEIWRFQGDAVVAAGENRIVLEGVSHTVLDQTDFAFG